MSDTAVILAAGRGQKLNYLNTPKPLILVGGQPLIIRKIKLLQEAGISRILIVVGSYGDAVRQTVRNHPEISAEIEFIDQSDDDGGVLKSFLAPAGRANNGFIITGSDLVFENNPFLSLKKKNHGEIMVDRNVEHNKFCGSGMKIKTGLLSKHVFDPEGNFNAWHAGIYWFSREGYERFADIIRSLGNARLSDVLHEYDRRHGFNLTGLPKMLWYDINTPETLIRAEMFLRSRQPSSRPTEVKVEKLEIVVPPHSFSYKKFNTTEILLEPGLINKLGKIRLMESERAASHHILITDNTVNDLFGRQVLEEMQGAGYGVTKFIIPDGEGSKSMPVYNDLAEKIIAGGIDEHSIIFALGGGVVANLSGFLASTLYRGIGLIHIPTSFMNMLDVSISLKQGINGQKGKNLVGSYYQPLMVLIDPAISIPDWLIRDGMSEAIKHALCQDKNFFNYLLDHNMDFKDVGFRAEVIRRAIELKISLMNIDMFENNCGMVLQYGHEIGHAVEFLSKFGLTHGQAISIGMRTTAELAHLMDVTSADTVRDHKNILKAYELPYSIPAELDKDAIIDILRYNKKTRGQDIRIVLPEYTGKVWKIKGEYGIPCPAKLIEKAVEKSYKE